MAKRKKADNPYSTTSVESYVVPDCRFSITESSLRNSLSHIYEKALQSLKTPTISWADAFAGAAASGLVAAIIKLFNPNTTTSWPDWGVPALFTLVAGILIARRTSAKHKALSNFDARDEAVNQAMRKLRTALPSKPVGDDGKGDDVDNRKQE